MDDRNGDDARRTLGGKRGGPDVAVRYSASKPASPSALEANDWNISARTSNAKWDADSAISGVYLRMAIGLIVEALADKFKVL